MQIENFGKTTSGVAVQKITLRSEDLSVSILTLGAIVQSVRLAGVGHDLTLGADDVAAYEGAKCYHGSLIAPVVNRLTGARAMVAGQEAVFEANFLGKHCLHSGAAGTQLQVWQIVDHSETAVTLALRLPHGAGGFAGNRDVKARFSLDQARLRMDAQVTSDAPTLWNSANHSYWNLDGSADFAGHVVQVDADHYLPTTDEFVPTGEIASVAGGEMDFRSPRTIGPNTPPLDNCFCLARGQGPLREVLTLRGKSGVTLRLSTTEAGVQLYDCRHDGFKGVAIEAQNWPDAPNHAGFPSIELGAGKTVVQSTVWHFTKG